MDEYIVNVRLQNRRFAGERGESESEPGTFAKLALHGDAAGHLFHNMSHDRQAETGAADVARAGLIHAVETFEDARDLFRGDTDAGVGDRNHGRAVDAFYFDTNLAVG